MHTHGFHHHCNHILKYCEHCDVVYCDKCGREWGEKRVSHYTYTVPNTWVYQGVPYTVTWRNGTSDYTLTPSNGTPVKSKDVISAFNMSVTDGNQHSHNHNF